MILLLGLWRKIKSRRLEPTVDDQVYIEAIMDDAIINGDAAVQFLTDDKMRTDQSNERLSRDLARITQVEPMTALLGDLHRLEKKKDGNV